MKYHIGVNINAALERLKNGDNIFEPATPLEAFKVLMGAMAQGKINYTGCDNEKPNGSCAGHEVISE